MDKHIKECAAVFLRDQKRLFDEPVVFDVEEAEEFLEDCFAQYCKNIKELKQVMDDEGMDISGMSRSSLKYSSSMMDMATFSLRHNSTYRVLCIIVYLK